MVCVVPSAFVALRLLPSLKYQYAPMKRLTFMYSSYGTGLLHQTISYRKGKWSNDHQPLLPPVAPIEAIKCPVTPTTQCAG